MPLGKSVRVLFGRINCGSGGCICGGLWVGLVMGRRPGEDSPRVGSTLQQCSKCKESEIKEVLFFFCLVNSSTLVVTATTILC